MEKPCDDGSDTNVYIDGFFCPRSLEGLREGGGGQGEGGGREGEKVRIVSEQGVR